MVQAFLMFAGMNMPERKHAFSSLARLRKTVGAEDFSKAVLAMGLPEETSAGLLKALEGEAQPDEQASENEEKPDLRQVLVGNTIAVLTRVPEKKEEWWKSMRQLEKDARGQEQTDLAFYANSLMRLLEGSPPDSLTTGIPEAFKEDWQAILAGISKKE